MANITLTIDDALLKQARIKAAQDGTSLNAVVREYLKAWTDLDRERRRAAKSILDRSRQAESSSMGGRPWTREELYEERLGRYGKK